MGITSRTQRTIELVVVIIALLSTVVTVGTWIGRAEEQHEVMKADIQELKETAECLDDKIANEEAQRRSEYLRLETRLTDLATGQDWIIMKLKGEI